MGRSSRTSPHVDRTRLLPPARSLACGLSAGGDIFMTEQQGGWDNFTFFGGRAVRSGKRDIIFTRQSLLAVSCSVSGCCQKCTNSGFWVSPRSFPFNFPTASRPRCSHFEIWKAFQPVPWMMAWLRCSVFFCCICCTAPVTILRPSMTHSFHCALSRAPGEGSVKFAHSVQVLFP